MGQTLDQERAAHAWQCAKRRAGLDDPKDAKDYVVLAKGAPALVMGSGLMAALAFWQSRGKKPSNALVDDTLSWLAKRKLLPADFESAMSLMAQQASARQYMQITDEVLALLRWLRQFAAAVEEGR
jgi:CRISPR-associated protein Cmr5